MRLATRSGSYQHICSSVPLTEKCQGLARDNSIIVGHYRVRQFHTQSKSERIIVEIIDDTSYTFESIDCVLMFKKFGDVYGTSFI
jgi:hypothetical protein